MLHISTVIIWFLVTGFSRRVRMTQVKSRALQPARLYLVLLPQALIRNRNCCTRRIWSPELHPCSSPDTQLISQPSEDVQILSLNQTSSLTENIPGPRASLRIPAQQLSSEGWVKLLRSSKPLTPNQPYRKGVSNGHLSILALPSLCSLCFLGKEDKLPLESALTL